LPLCPALYSRLGIFSEKGFKMNRRLPDDNT
jgi:hypothetical protein